MSNFRRVAVLGLLVLLAAVAGRLGFWQLDRQAQRRSANHLELAVRTLPPLDLNQTGASDSATPGRRITAQGEFLPRDLLLRNRVHREAPGVHVVTPFRVAGTGELLWVLRGFAHAPDGVRPVAVAQPTGAVATIHGLLAAFPVTNNRGRPAATAGDTTWRRLDSAAALDRLPGALPLYLYLEGDVDGPGRLPAVEPPTLDEGPHLSYAIQWFGIAIAILAFGFIVVRRRGARPSVPPAAAP